MDLLIVHRDPEMGPALVQMVQNYTRLSCHLALSDAAALDWGRSHRKCDLLLTQVFAEEIQGLALGSSLSEMFPALQALFFPSYPAAEQRLEVNETKVFPEPIEGDSLLAAIERAEKAVANAPDLFHVIEIIQMCCLSRCNGALQLVRDQKNGLVFVRNGKIVHAETGASRGPAAVFEMVGWQYVEFAYERSVRPPMETIDAPWDEILIEAVGQRREEKTLRSRQSA